MLATVAQPLAAQETTIVQKTVVLPERECQLKYAYLDSFSLLNSWPETAFDSPSAPFVIGVYGTGTPVNSSTVSLDGRKSEDAGSRFFD